MMKKSRTAILLCAVLTAMFLFTGCGRNSPESVVQSLIKAYNNGNIKKVMKCYGMEEGEDSAFQEEAEEAIDYFKAMNAKSLDFEDCDVIQEYETYDYVYIYYLINLGGGLSYPKLNTFFVATGDGSYYVIPSGNITSEMSEQASTVYMDFMSSQVYLNYEAAYLTFTQENPDFEETLVEPSEDILDEPSEDSSQYDQTGNSAYEQSDSSQYDQTNDMDYDQTGNSQYEQSNDSDYDQTGNSQYEQSDDSDYDQTGNSQYEQSDDTQDAQSDS